MPKRPIDGVRIEAIDTDAGVFDRFTSLEITNDLTAPAEASFEVGDDGSWRKIERLIALGSRFRVVVNDRLRLTGQVHVNDCQTDAPGGATVRFVVRTKFADAAYASADPTISVRGATLKDIILRAYASQGFVESDFVFNADVSRDLMTGKSSRGGPNGDFGHLRKGGKKVPTEKIDLEAAKVNPPETIYEFVERHLLRFHLTHWDSPDGKIVVAAPDDTQQPLYFFRMKRGPLGQGNNLLSGHRIRDLSEAPSVLWVAGLGGKADYSRSRIARAIAVQEVQAAKLDRPVIIIDESVRSLDQAESRVLRELSARLRKLEAWEIVTDGWSFWDGRRPTNYAINAVADMDVDTAGGSAGAYLVHRVNLRRDSETGDTANMSVVARGLWVL